MTESNRLSRRGLLRVGGAVGAATVAGLVTPTLAQADAMGSGLSKLELPPATADVTPFTLRVPESMLKDLRRRLGQTRWPDHELVDDWTQGVPLPRLQRLVEHWRTRYDWRRAERFLNKSGQHRTVIDGLGIHLLHVRSRHPKAMPLLLTHGWPGSVLEFRHVIGPLTDPTRYGGRAEDAFHVVIPSLPGYGLSDKPRETGWDRFRTAEAWSKIMSRLGYDHYLAQGGDWGGVIATQLGRMRPKGLLGIHLNLANVVPANPDPDPTPEEKLAMSQLDTFSKDGAGYQHIQSTRPQTIGYGLTDSPVGQAGWRGFPPKCGHRWLCGE
ncbi:hypothetical protein Pth03_79200 [Planotetraspora thailandica]|uniref:Epoxide hydrolase N-terminal domain-containing protein n=1 Tax=Planotetraspora thailandica TaxID=487172 RepID=A0A8J3Y2G7_9ACTN|nr:epoxide hydrolase [Planotetraspora thailandica]GII59531.1 hypothetical protein Pth03_79200 [Planotetraspora thailandica]